jgi:hypothetical protein
LLEAAVEVAEPTTLQEEVEVVVVWCVLEH